MLEHPEKTPLQDKGQTVDHVLLIIGIALALFLAFLNGFRDGGTLVAASVLSKSIDPQSALYAACAGELLGPFVLGSAVAATLGTEVFDAPLESQEALLCLCAAVVSATTWSLLTRWAGAPAGSTHTLLGGLLGGFVAAFGLSGVNWSVGPAKVLVVLFLVPIVGFVVSASTMTLSKLRLPRRRKAHRKGEWLALFVLSAGHGGNNAQKATALITMMLVASGYLRSFEVPLWSVVSAAVVLTLGLSMGAWRIVKIISRKTYQLTPVHSLVSQASGGAVVLVATLLGYPISSNQIIKASLVGASPVERQRAPGRILMKDMIIAWVVNFPAAAITASTLYWIAAGTLGHGMGSFERIMEFMGQ